MNTHIKNVEKVVGSNPCLVEKVVTAQKTSDGAGVSLQRSLGTNQLQTVDPFLMLDEFKSDDPSDYIAGFPDHPHRGFETVTYMLAGKLEHRDHKGNSGFIEAGGIQWMTAGRGIIHSEMPIQENGLMWGFQLWVNLPSCHKMKPPAYQNIDPDQIPSLTMDNGAVIRVVAGESFGVEGPVKGIDVGPLFLDIHLPVGQTLIHPMEISHHTLVYAFQGTITIGDSEEKSQVLVHEGQLAVLTKGDSLVVNGTEEEARFLVLSGRPIGEPIAKYGPLVMNTEAEIQQAIRDYQSGRLAI